MPPLAAFGGTQVFDNTVRLFVIFTGFALGLACVRLAWVAWRRGDYDRLWGILAFGFLVLNPAIGGLARFDQAIFWPSTGTYLAGLLFGLVALGRRIAMYPPWKRVRSEWVTRADARRTRQRDHEDAARDTARTREDDALVYDRDREDEATRGSRTREDRDGGA
jgi:hypothetical protein